MNKEQTRKNAEVMMAAEYDESGICTNVEVSVVGSGEWKPSIHPMWDWFERKYRIKPKYVYHNVYGTSVSNLRQLSVYDGRKTASKTAAVGSPTDRLRFEIIDGKLANPVLIGLEANE